MSNRYRLEATYGRPCGQSRVNTAEREQVTLTRRRLPRAASIRSPRPTRCEIRGESTVIESKSRTGFARIMGGQDPTFLRPMSGQRGTHADAPVLYNHSQCLPIQLWVFVFIRTGIGLSTTRFRAYYRSRPRHTERASGCLATEWEGVGQI